MLPDEMEVKAAIETKYRRELNAMTALHNTVVSMLTADGWTIRKKRGLDHVVVETVMGLLTKACKTFRAIQILCERGFQPDAGALVRVLMETTVAIVFILQTRSRQRALVYHAHGIKQGMKMLNEWKSTGGLKRKATKTLLKQATDQLTGYMKLLPATTDVSHWSGKKSLKNAVTALRGDATYATLYRVTSQIAHASDASAHCEADSTTRDLVCWIEPTVEGFEAPSYAARELLWNAGNRIDQRLGLGFSATLAPHKLTRADVQKGQE